MHINLISRENDSGLSVDIELLVAFLRERLHYVRLVDFEAASLDADVNIYVELFHPKHLATARKHVGIFNLEWFDPKWEAYLSSMTQLWAKSSKAYEWYRERGHDQVTWTGFLSRDLRDETIPRRQAVLHVAGASIYKGTGAVLDTWREHGLSLPPLTVISRDLFEPIPNVKQWTGRVSDAKFRELMNEHWFHLCPSVIEGWGHYITEALSCGNVVITTDASPMHEHVLPQFGALMTPDVVFTKHGLDYCHFGQAPILAAIREIRSHDDRKLHHMGADARKWWQMRQRGFTDNADRLLKELA